MPSSSPRLLVFASINIDLTARVNRLPRLGETLLSDDATACPGGKGANQAVAAARLGAHIGIVCCVGDDLQGRALRQALESEGIEIVGWHVDPERPTGAALINVLPDGQNAIVVASGANQSLRPDHVDVALGRGDDWDFVLATMESPLAVVRRVAEHESEIPLLLDAGGDAAALRGEPLLRRCTLTLNEAELAALVETEIADVDAAREVLLEIRPRCAVAKLGEQGSLWVDDAGTVVHEPALAVDAVDTVAAGDAHSAGLAVAWAERNLPLRVDAEHHDSVREILRFANAAGALACTRPGAMPAMPTRESVDELLRR